MKIKEKIKLMWRILRAKRKLIVFDPNGIYGNAVILTKECAENDPLALDTAKRLLRENLDYIIPAGYAKEGRFDFYETQEPINETTVVSIKWSPLSVVMNI